MALQGDLVAAVDAFKAAAPMLVLPAKFAVAFPLVYHYLGGVRHVFWDKSHYGNMARPLKAHEPRTHMPRFLKPCRSRQLHVNTHPQHAAPGCDREPKSVGVCQGEG